MGRLRCYEQNNGRDKIIELVKYSRKQRELSRTGTDDMPVKVFSASDVIKEHYNQSRLQATIPGMTARKIAAIRTGLNNL